MPAKFWICLLYSFCVHCYDLCHHIGPDGELRHVIEKRWGEFNDTYGSLVTCGKCSLPLIFPFPASEAVIDGHGVYPEPRQGREWLAVTNSVSCPGGSVARFCPMKLRCHFRTCCINESQGPVYTHIDGEIEAALLNADYSEPHL